MTSTPSHTDFARFEDRIDETIEKQIARVETKLDEVGRAVRSLAVLEERQSTNARQVDDLRASSAKMGERFDGRVSDVAKDLAEQGKALRELEARVSMYAQRYVGVTMTLAAGWAVASHFLKG